MCGTGEVPTHDVIDDGAYLLLFSYSTYPPRAHCLCVAPGGCLPRRRSCYAPCSHPSSLDRTSLTVCDRRDSLTRRPSAAPPPPALVLYLWIPRVDQVNQRSQTTHTTNSPFRGAQGYRCPRRTDGQSSTRKEAASPTHSTPHTPHPSAGLLAQHSAPPTHPGTHTSLVDTPPDPLTLPSELRRSAGVVASCRCVSAAY